MSRVSKFRDFFDMLRNLRAFSIVIYEKFNFSIFSIFLTLFKLVCKLLTSFFSQFLLVSKLYELSLLFKKCPEA